MKIGVSNYSFNQYIKAGKMTALETIVKAKEMGFPGIEIVAECLPKPITEEYLRETKATAEKVGIEITAYLTGANLLGATVEEREEGLKLLFQRLDEAAILGAKVIRFDIGYKFPEMMGIDEAIDIVAPYIRRVAERGAELGIMTTSENHGILFQDWDRMERLHRAVNSKNYNLLVDVGNFMCADFDNVISVSKLAHLAVHVHLKDMEKVDYYDECDKTDLFKTRACNYLKPRPLGEGDSKVAQCIAILESAGFNGYYDIEYEAKEDCIEGIAKSYEYLKSLNF